MALLALFLFFFFSCLGLRLTHIIPPTSVDNEPNLVSEGGLGADFYPRGRLKSCRVGRSVSDVKKSYSEDRGDGWC